MRIRLNQWLLLALIVTSLLLGCNQSKTDPPKGQQATHNAIKSLRKVEAATQVKASYDQYSQLVIDAKAEVNAAVAELPEGELKRELMSAMEAYEDAGMAWRVSEREILRDDEEPGQTLSKKYSVKIAHGGVEAAGIRYREGIERIGKPNYESPYHSGILKEVWSIASRHLNRASSLIEK